MKSLGYNSSMKIIMTWAILFSFAFSSVHEFAYAFYDEDPCSVSEYVDEIAAPSQHDDICDSHFEYHHAYILPQVNVLISQTDLNTKPLLNKESYTFQANLDFMKPPIS